jgi:EAL domain-containing protein (putative c-di-GMP-specific phosphodiesterase class I)
MGLKLSIDDFGTGYSSLSYLKRFPIDSIKIDRSFVRDVTTNLEDASICGAIVAMAHTLCIKVIAEGVETQEQWHYLKTLGCDEVQGFLVSKPVPVPEFEHFVANWQGECPEKMAA